MLTASMLGEYAAMLAQSCRDLSYDDRKGQVVYNR